MTGPGGRSVDGGERTTHTYKLLKSAWGIWISITATVSIGSCQGDGAGPAVRVVFSDSAAVLPAKYKAELVAGIVWCELTIAEGTGQECVLVDVERVSFMESDFQVDGLSVAMCRWAEAAFGLEPRRIDESFDRAGNRYLFEWK